MRSVEGEKYEVAATMSEKETTNRFLHSSCYAQLKGVSERLAYKPSEVTLGAYTHALLIVSSSGSM